MPCAPFHTPSESRGHRRRGEKAFSLIEILTAMAILSIIVFVLASMANTAGTIWTQGENQNQHRQRARAVLDVLSRELRSATLGVAPLAPEGNALQLVINPPLAQKYRNRDAIFWQAPIATETSKGDLAEIGYFIRWTGNQASLCRFFINPGDSDYLVYETPNAWLTDALLEKVAPADKAGQYRGLFLENVIGMWVTPKSFLADGTEVPAQNGTDPHLFDSRAVTPNALPSVVEISLVLLDTGTAKQLENPAEVTALYSSCLTAEAFVERLPTNVRRGASIVRNTVALRAEPL
jgi:prepilin-type N-terminal cleavage/methylation domain-containing protein